MATSFDYSSRVDEETMNLEFPLPELAGDDFPYIPELDSFTSTDGNAMHYPDSHLLPSTNASLWNPFTPDFLSASETQFPTTASTSQDSWFPNTHSSPLDPFSLPDPASLSFDMPQFDQSQLDDLLGATPSEMGTGPPSPNSDDSHLRLSWVKAALKDIALARAAADPRPISQKQKQMDASIALYSELQNDLGSSLREDLHAYGQPMVSQHSSGSTSGSSFDNASFSMTSSPTSSSSTMLDLSPAHPTFHSSSSAGPSRTAQPSSTGGVQMVLDLNMNEATSLPRKHRPKTQAERQSYIAARKQGACEWHRKQRKRCTCVDKSTTTPVNAKQQPNRVQKISAQSSRAVHAVSTGEQWRQTKVWSSGESQQFFLAQGIGCLDTTSQCCDSSPCGQSLCPRCSPHSEERVSWRDPVFVYPRFSNCRPGGLNTPFSPDDLTTRSLEPWTVEDLRQRLRGPPLSSDTRDGNRHSPATVKQNSVDLSLLMRVTRDKSVLESSDLSNRPVERLNTSKTVFLEDGVHLTPVLDECGKPLQRLQIRNTQNLAIDPGHRSIRQQTRTATGNTLVARSKHSQTDTPALLAQLTSFKRRLQSYSSCLGQDVLSFLGGVPQNVAKKSVFHNGRDQSSRSQFMMWLAIWTLLLPFALMETKYSANQNSPLSGGGQPLGVLAWDKLASSVEKMDSFPRETLRLHGTGASPGTFENPLTRMVWQITAILLFVFVRFGLTNIMRQPARPAPALTTEQETGASRTLAPTRGMAGVTTKSDVRDDGIIYLHNGHSRVTVNKQDSRGNTPAQPQENLEPNHHNSRWA
ncbi:hypothetical protein FQN55_008246 [Onygenales sp. PD_40]|nr:hypothetical protein FQN55_008246 [Onygenales sp. PD_40]KAK2786064.1 hypothetical protein FQN53_006973 [Emmonsiellopsis sp. PD_33]